MTELFTQTESPDDLLVSRAVGAREVLEQMVALADHLQQPATRGVILLVRAEVLGQLVDARGQDRDLHFRRTGVFIVNLVIRDELRLRVGGNGHYGSMSPSLEFRELRNQMAGQTSERPGARCAGRPRKIRARGGNGK